MQFSGVRPPRVKVKEEKNIKCIGDMPGVEIGLRSHLLSSFIAKKERSVRNIPILKVLLPISGCHLNLSLSVVLSLSCKLSS